LGALDDVPVHELDPHGGVAERDAAERGSEVAPKDALVVMTAPLLGDAVLLPVVSHVRERLRRGGCLLEPPPPLLGFELALLKLEAGFAPVIEDLALPLAVLVDPADAPLAVVLRWPCHG